MHHVEHPRGESGDRAQYPRSGDGSAGGIDPHHPPALQPNTGHLGLLVNLDAAAVGSAAVAPGDRIVTRNRAGLVKQRAQYRGMAAAGHVDHGNAALHEGGVDGLGAHPVMLVDLRAPAHGAHGRVRVRERVVPARRIEQVQIEVFGEVLPQAHAFIVKLDALGSQVVRADDRGVAAGVAAADVALVDHGDVADAVVAGQIISGGQAVPATADDHYIVARLQRVVPREHPRFRMLAREAETN